jgi:hypothetical protein
MGGRCKDDFGLEYVAGNRDQYGQRHESIRNYQSNSNVYGRYELMNYDQQRRRMISRGRNQSCTSLNSNTARPPNPRRLSRKMSSNLKNGLRNGSDYLKGMVPQDRVYGHLANMKANTLVHDQIFEEDELNPDNFIRKQSSTPEKNQGGAPPA